jgi:hypothetical protein
MDSIGATHHGFGSWPEGWAAGAMKPRFLASGSIQTRLTACSAVDLAQLPLPH